MKSLASRILENQFGVVVVVEKNCEMLFSSIKLNNNSTVCDILIAYTGVLLFDPEFNAHDTATLLIYYIRRSMTSFILEIGKKRSHSEPSGQMTVPDGPFTVFFFSTKNSPLTVDSLLYFLTFCGNNPKSPF